MSCQHDVYINYYADYHTNIVEKNNDLVCIFVKNDYLKKNNSQIKIIKKSNYEKI